MFINQCTEPSSSYCTTNILTTETANHLFYDYIIEVDIGWFNTGNLSGRLKWSSVDCVITDDCCWSIYIVVGWIE